MAPNKRHFGYCWRYQYGIEGSPKVPGRRRDWYSGWRRHIKLCAGRDSRNLLRFPVAMAGAWNAGLPIRESPRLQSGSRSCSYHGRPAALGVLTRSQSDLRGNRIRAIRVANSECADGDQPRADPPAAGVLPGIDVIRMFGRDVLRLGENEAVRLLRLPAGDWGAGGLRMEIKACVTGPMDCVWGGSANSRGGGV